MATGFLVNGLCYSNVTSSLDAFKGQPLHFYNNGLSTFAQYVSASTISPTGLVTFSTKNNVGTTVITNGTFQLNTCTDSGMLSDYPLVDIVFVIGLFLAFALGMITGQQR